MRAKIVTSLVFLVFFALCLASCEDNLESGESGGESTDSEDAGEPEEASEIGKPGESIESEKAGEPEGADESRDAETSETSGILLDAVTYLDKVQLRGDLKKSGLAFEAVTRVLE